ncbi:hypothetical protein ACN20G_36820 (plasmid) [Streptomyces sp. BI20]|uniref:hypothetical protein n=1 Tax=Streptomyces sp. BI20 TaxID=3403460 RepID=UPI003C744AFF
MDSMPHPLSSTRYPADHLAAATVAGVDRIALSAALGVEVDLLLGPVEGESGLAEQTRQSALVDMLAESGAFPAELGAKRWVTTRRLGLLAGWIEDMERDDNGRGYEAEPESVTPLPTQATTTRTLVDGRWAGRAWAA